MEDYKYTAIIDWTVNYIKDNHLKPDDRFFTENELCTMHNVSRQTVRQALMKLESDNVIKRVRGSGTFVSGGIRIAPSVTGTVGVVSTYFSDYIFPHIITGAQRVLDKAGCPVQIAITHNLGAEEAQALRNMLACGVRGLIVEPSGSALPNMNTKLYDNISRVVCAYDLIHFGFCCFRDVMLSFCPFHGCSSSRRNNRYVRGIIRAHCNNDDL